MTIERLVRVVLLVAVLTAVGCAPPGGGAGHVAGLTENRVCAGPVSPDGCLAQFNPASDSVTISQNGIVINRMQSASNGVFSVDLTPGAYEFQAGVNFPGGGVDCPAVKVTVPASIVAVTLQCTIELP